MNAVKHSILALFSQRHQKSTVKEPHSEQEADTKETDIFRKTRKRLPKRVFVEERWKNAAGAGQFPHVVYVLNGGGRCIILRHVRENRARLIPGVVRKTLGKIVSEGGRIRKRGTLAGQVCWEGVKCVREKSAPLIQARIRLLECPWDGLPWTAGASVILGQDWRISR